jgi:hypothetical protein
MESKVKLTKHLSKIGEMRFFLIGLEKLYQFDIIVQVLKSNFGVEIIREFYGISFKRVELKAGEDEFVLYWDDLLGIFFVAFDQSDDKNQRLEEFVKRAIPLLESYLNPE